MTEPSTKAIDRLLEAVAASREINERRIQALEKLTINILETFPEGSAIALSRNISLIFAQK